MSDSGLARFAPLTGVLFVLLAIISFALFGEEPPEIGEDSTAEVIKFWADGGDAMSVSVVFQGLACAALVFFGGSLYKTLRAGNEESSLPLIAFAGILLLATGLLVDASVTLTLQQSASDIQPAAVEALTAFYENDFIPMGAGVFTAMLASGITILRTGALPKWMGWIALVFVVVGVTPAGFVAFIGAALWFAIAGIVMTMRAGSAPAPAA